MRSELELHRLEIDKMNEIILNSRKYPLENSQTQALYEKFIKAAFLLDDNEQDIITLLYAKNVVGVDIPNLWWTDEQWYEQVGQILNGIGDPPKNNGSAFWNEVKEAIPNFLTREELNFLLVNDSHGSGGFNLILNMSDFGYSVAAGKMAIYIHAYK